MPQSPEPMRTAFAVRLPASTEARTRAAAATLGVTLTDVVREALDDWLIRHDTTQEGPR